MTAWVSSVRLWCSSAWTYDVLVSVNVQLKEWLAIPSAFPLCNDFHYRELAFRTHNWQNIFTKSRRIISNFLYSSPRTLDEERGHLLEQAPGAQTEEEKTMLNMFLPSELYLQSTKAQWHVPGKKITRVIQESCLWVTALGMSHSGFSLLRSWHCVPYHFPMTMRPLLDCQPSRTETSLPPGFFPSLSSPRSL